MQFDFNLCFPLNYPIFLGIHHFTNSPIAIEPKQLIEMSKNFQKTQKLPKNRTAAGREKVLISR